MTNSSMVNSRWFNGVSGSYSFFLIFLIAVFIRILNLIFSDLSYDAMLFEDAAQYWGAATASENFWDVVTTIFFEQTERTPGYAVFLATVISIFGADFAPVLLAQCLFDSSTCLIIMVLGQKMLPKAGWVFGFLAALWPNLIIHSGLILTDCLFTFLFSWFLLSFSTLLTKQTIKNAVFAGTLLGLATLVRPLTQFMILFTPIILPVIFVLSKTCIKTAIYQSLIVFTMASVLISPLLLKNYFRYDSLALSSQNGTHLQNWVVSEVVMLRDGIGRDVSVIQLQAKTREKLSKLTPLERANPFVRSAQQIDTALTELAATPPSIIAKSWLQGAVINIASPAFMIDKRIRQLPHVSFTSDTSGDLFKRLAQFISGSSYLYVTALIASGVGAVIVSLFQFAGFFIQARINGMLTILSALTVAYLLLINGPVGSPKYRLPIEPILIIWFGCALISFRTMITKALYRRTIP